MNEHLKRSKKQEKRGAKKYGGTTNAGSGSGGGAYERSQALQLGGIGRKNDVRTNSWSIEFKTTTADSYRLTHAELQLAERQALLEHRTALFGIDFARPTGTDRYVVLNESDLFELLDDLCTLELDKAELHERLLDAQAELSMVHDGS